MSKIVVIAKTVTHRARFIAHVRRVTGMAIADIQSRLDAKRPLTEWTLFMNDHDQIAWELEELLKLQDQSECALEIFELKEQDTYAGSARDLSEISSAVLRNILATHERAKLERESNGL